MSIRASCMALVVLLVGACSDTSTEPASAVRFSSVATGYHHSCGITRDRRVYCWGGGESGQVGTFDLDVCEGGSVGDGATCALWPREVELDFVSSLTAGGAHTCALDTDGRAFCWGDDDNGQLGSGVRPDACAGLADLCTAEPERVIALPYVRLSAGSAHTCGITVDGEAQCWGYGPYGRLGSGGTVDRALPVPVAGGYTFREIAAGGSSTCGLTTDSRAFCWGYNHLGQLGDGTTTSRSVPTPVQTDQRFMSITVGTAHACALTAAGAAWCWGANGGGELGTGDPETLCGSYGCDLTPRPVLGGHVFQTISAGGATCGTTAQAVLCWGENEWGETGTGLSDRIVTQPTRTKGPALRGVSVTFDHACAIDANDAAWCWGVNFSGSLGIGTSGGFCPTPVKVIPPDDTVD